MYIIQFMVFNIAVEVEKCYLALIQTSLFSSQSTFVPARCISSNYDTKKYSRCYHPP